MRRLIPRVIQGALLISFLLLWGCHGAQLQDSGETDLVGPQSPLARGEQQVLVAAVQFPDVEPSLSLERIRRRAVTELNQYVKEQSYGLTWINADFRGWVKLPDPISKYQISPYNFKVDRTRVRKLIEDTMTALEKDVTFSRYQHILVVPGVFTTPGKGYGMLCYCANPGMLTGVKGRLSYATLTSRGGKEFRGGVFVGAENAHLGMFAHDFFHALGGIDRNKRLVPCLYDYERQSDASSLPMPEHHAIYMGPWDIMSEHFMKRDEPAPGVSSFTKIRLGWVSREQVAWIRPGETAHAFLSPLSKGGDRVVAKIPLKGGRYYLIENRQPIGFDQILPDSGILILKVDPSVEEGTGTVRVMNADRNSPRFSRATFRLDQEKRNMFLDRENGVSVLPLWNEEGKQGILITTPERNPEALKAASTIQRMLTRRSRKDRLVEDCVASFKRFDFKRCIELGQ